MYRYVYVEFPETDRPPTVVHSAVIKSERYHHESATIYFRDWGIDYESIVPGTPVRIVFGARLKREFCGYVHHITPDIAPGKNFTEVFVVGASMVMKQPRQAIYTDVTADAVIDRIAKQYKFASLTVPHPRQYEQVAQTGQSDWSFMVELAKQNGYSLRAENTELYFQPMLYEFTNSRYTAPYFIMRNANHPAGSTIYSFTPIVGESIPFPDAKKGAVAVAGVDKFNKKPLSVTKQKANKKTRTKQKPEFFDIFETKVVAPDQEIAKHEATAAEDRNSFPYRATVEVLGSANLRPDMPIYLSGLGSSYSGYWTILKAEHRIIETEIRRDTYTTVLTVGTDSLGLAEPWIDGSLITSPDSVQERVIIPNVRQTNVVPKSSLINGSGNLTPQIVPSFGKSGNRVKPTKNVKWQVEPPQWKSDTKSLYSVAPEPKKPSYVVNRLQKKGVR